MRTFASLSAFQVIGILSGSECKPRCVEWWVEGERLMRKEEEFD